MLPFGGGCFVFKLHDAVLMVLQVIEGLGKLVVEAAKKTLRLGGLLLELVLSIVITGIRAAQPLRRRFWRPHITITHAHVARSHGIRLGVHVGLGDAIGLEHSRVYRRSRLAGEL